MLVESYCETKPDIDTTNITNNDVLIALLIGIAVINTSAGTIRNPPPTPKNPVSVPTTVLSQTECIGTIFPKSAITRYSHAAIA